MDQTKILPLREVGKIRTIAKPEELTLHPAEGEMLYCQSDNSIYVFNGRQWQSTVAERRVESVVRIEDQKADLTRVEKSLQQAEQKMRGLGEAQRDFDVALKAFSTEMEALFAGLESKLSAIEEMVWRDHQPQVFEEPPGETPNALLFKVVLGTLVFLVFLQILFYFLR